MKNLTLLFLLIFVSSALSITPVHAQTGEALWLEANTTAYKTRETVIVTINGVSTTPFQGFTAQIRYDPSCLLPENGTGPIPGMNGLAVPQAPGLADVSFASNTPQIANGVLAILQFQALKGCQTSLNIESAALVVRGETGLATPITDVNINQTPVILSIDSAEGNPQPKISGESVLPLTPVSVSNPNPVTSYDQVPYTSLPIPNTHVGRLAAVSALLGRDCAPAGKCRVLEIGCASGVNLMAMAQQLPDSEFLGIDASARQIEAGRALAAQAGIGNLRLEPLSVAQTGEDLGQFDYVICHGVYSWVSTETQEQILRAVKERLAPQGIALVSYNVLPGWAVPAELRRMLLYRARRFSGPLGKVRAARELMAALEKSLEGREDGWSRALGQLLVRLRTTPDDTQSRVAGRPPGPMPGPHVHT